MRRVLTLLILLVAVSPAWAQVQYDRDTAATAKDKLDMVGCVRRDATSGATVTTDGDRAPCIVDANGMLWVTLGTVATAMPYSTSGTLQSAATANGNGTTLATANLVAAVLTVNCASCSGGTTINFEGTEDATNFVALQAHQLGTNTIATTTATAGLTYWHLPVAGLQSIRARISAYSAGTVTITGHTSANDTRAQVMNANVVNTPTVTVGTFPDNEPFNVAQINGATPLMGTGNTGTGSLRVTIATDQAQLTNALKVDGSAVTQPVSGTVTANAGTNLNTSSLLTTSAHDAAFGTAGTADAQVRSIQGIASMTPVQVSQATASNLNATVVGTGTLAVQVDGAALTALQLIDNLPNTIGSTTSGQSGALGLGAVTTAAPTYTTAQTHPLSLQTDGALRVAGAVSCSNCTGSGASHTDDALFTVASGAVAPAGFLFDDAGPDSVNEGDVGVGRMSANRVPYATIRDAAGNERGVNVTAGNALVVDGSASTQPVSGTVTVGTFPDNEPFNVSQINGVTVLMGAGNTGTGSQRVTEATDSQLSAGVGATGDAAATAGSTGSVTAKLRLMTSQLDAMSTTLTSIAADQTGASVHYRTSAGATEDEHEIKGTAGRLFSVTVTNTNAAARYLRCYNLTAANTTPGTSTVFFGLAIPGATTGAGFTTNFGPAGIAFGTALTCAFTTGAADTDVAEVAANEIKAVYAYK